MIKVSNNLILAPVILFFLLTHTGLCRSEQNDIDTINIGEKAYKVHKVYMSKEDAYQIDYFVKMPQTNMEWFDEIREKLLSIDYQSCKPRQDKWFTYNSAHGGKIKSTKRFMRHFWSHSRKKLIAVTGEYQHDKDCKDKLNDELYVMIVEYDFSITDESLYYLKSGFGCSIDEQPTNTPTTPASDTNAGGNHSQ